MTNKLLSVGAIAAAARDIGVAEAQLSAVVAVETGLRGGFDDAGRVRILYEAHVAHRLGAPLVPGLSVKSWDRSLYSPTSAGEWARLEEARKLFGDEIAYGAASWGLGQILGENHRRCGFDSATAMVEAMKTGENAQLKAMISFIVAGGLVDELRSVSADPETCRAFARGYNGAGYEQNAYHVKIADAFTKASRGAGDGILSSGDYGPEVASLQRALIGQGGATLKVDGDFGKGTRSAVERFQAAGGLTVTGAVDQATALALGIAPARGAES